MDQKHLSDVKQREHQEQKGSETLVAECERSLESLPPPCEMTKVTFTTWGQEVRDEKNAFLFSLFCLLETHRCLFLTETGCFFLTFNRCLQNNREHRIIKTSKTQSHAVYRKTRLVIGNVCYVINYWGGGHSVARLIQYIKTMPVCLGRCWSTKNTGRLQLLKNVTVIFMMDKLNLIFCSDN